MTQEGKQLLLEDLNARLLFGIKIKIGEHSDYKLICIVMTDEHPIKVEVIENGIPYKIEVSPDIIKPYLRPLSSMTEEEKKEYKHLIAFSGSPDGAVNLVDWLNKKMFAYRTINGKNMFELGLAIEAPKGMYDRI